MISQVVTNEVFARLGIHPLDTKLLRGYNDNVFEAGQNEKFIVKILEKSVSSELSLLAELEWLNYLHMKGIDVVKPLYINGTDYIEEVNDDYYFVVFQKVNGVYVTPKDTEIWGGAFFEKWGELMGKIHSASKNYSAKNSRPMWNDNKILIELGALELNPQLIQKWARYNKEFENLPISKDNFGLIHGDLHCGNLIVTNSSVYAIDFGDSEYHWFAYDIAIAIYHTALTVAQPERDEFAKRFFDAFMNGYGRGNTNTDVIKDINYFIEYRHLYSFTYHSLYADKSQLTEQQLKYLKNMELSLINDSPFLTVLLG
ncbi:phosphotransferase enzyme family protein [Paenibacillus sp. J22TS3]|uniref:phosphotransferase enzyme family protein n=1 Tax=Paenibacillus sp. J22TS3 TaxID=2807192 RepID=UPI001B163649|nr:phosphotransferase [Paenibacillus sp. J22TS3]GIP23167.1 hypothetical protein J22TS3_34420 [Paenibacillus sp. J22TS3]